MGTLPLLCRRRVKEGIKEGERNAKFETARRMLARGKMSAEEIAEDVGISVEEVMALSREGETDSERDASERDD